MPFKLLTNWSRWAEGDTITGGDIAEVSGCVGNLPGWTPPTDTECEKLGLTKPKASEMDERIKELVKRGVLHGIGSDAIYQPDTPMILQPTYQERVMLGKGFSTILKEIPDPIAATDYAGQSRAQMLRKFEDTQRQANRR